MQLIRCPQCGKAVVTDETFLQIITDKIEETFRKAEKCRNGQQKQLYMSEISVYKSMYKSFMHNISCLQQKKVEDYQKLVALTKYVHVHNLIDQETYIQIMEDSKQNAVESMRKNQKEIQRLYGEVESMSNKTKRDPTADAALKNLR